MHVDVNCQAHHAAAVAAAVAAIHCHAVCPWRAMQCKCDAEVKLLFQSYKKKILKNVLAD